jgi:hypothetical protein
MKKFPSYMEQGIYVQFFKQVPLKDLMEISKVYTFYYETMYYNFYLFYDNFVVCLSSYK